ncbi:hypothetical protein [Rhodopseudomonas palustris]|uniref:hypothetical protein n=1 Tax=Rhodopseudomonas palustris TaxID=1076 RepID=UPI00005D81A3|nr:hypothetical protein [Rhodopseudomonas palustris]
MADKKFKYTACVTDVLTARNPNLSEPHTEGDFADGKYKTEAVASPEWTECFMRQVEGIISENFGRKVSVRPWKKLEDGTVVLKFKSPKKQPVLTDAKGKPLPAGLIIKGGALIRITGVVALWEHGGKRGVSLWPDAVRVIKLPEVFDPCAAFGPPEDGFDSADYSGAGRAIAAMTSEP